MLLRELFAPGAAAGAAAEVDVTSLAYDARSVEPGALFFCVPGAQRDGHDFAPEAVGRGAVALVVERPLALGVPELVVGSARAAMAPAAAAFHGDPTARLRVVGITGTNGKTTTAFLTRSLLEAAGTQAGLLGTVEQVIGGSAMPAERTTPEAIDLQRMFARMLAEGDRACVMEVSSHALALHRADAIQWAVAVFTNLTRDHLDFHRSMDEYFVAKRMLFDAAPAHRIANVDDEHGRRLARDFPGTVTVGIESADAELRATAVETGMHGSRFHALGREWHTSLPGRFNVLNALCAIAAARALGASDDELAAALPRAARAPGRFEPVDEGQGFAVLVDYAHTPDSLENVLEAARALAARELIAVFGCGGDRDRGKRAQMGAIAARLADVAIVTSDNPRSEDPAAIIGAVLAGVPEGLAGRVEPIEDRRAAIFEAIARARAGDVVVIAGKGHEQGQELVGGVKVPFDDVSVAREALHAAGVA